MFTNLTLFKTSFAMAVHAGTRQAVIAQNIANADTPGYVARDLQPFALDDAGAASALRATRTGHMHGRGDDGSLRFASVADERSDPNRNTVSVEEQMLNAVGAKRQHDRALAIYKSALGILRSSVGRM